MKSFLRNVCGRVKKEIEEEIDEAISGATRGGSSSGDGEGRSTAFSTQAGGGPLAGVGGGGGGAGGMDMLQGLMGLVSGGGSGGAGGGLSNLISGFTGGGGGGGGGAGRSAGGGSGALNTIIGLIQSQTGGTGLLPASVGKYLPMILKLAEILGHGMGDDSPRTEKNSDGSFIDQFVKTIIGGRKIFGGGGEDEHGKKIFKPVPKGGGTLPDIDYSNVSPSAQDYEAIRNECLQAGTLWEDPEFPAENASVFFSESERRRFTWLRPHELCSNPSFFVEGASRFDVNQGELGDCWLLAALANLTLNEKLFYQVVPEDNSFENGYAGVFHFRFWQYGQWIDVVIDDRLPTIDGKLMFLHSEDCNEFWSALLEKAYAKLMGSYESLKGGTTCEALEDFTGGITELYDLNTAPKNLFSMIQRAFERSSFLGCSIEPDPRVTEALTSAGLVRGHAYSITDVKVVDGIKLLRIKNPWGNEVEWKGAWSDGSSEWNQIDDETKEDIGLCFDSDGEFWMSFDDFMKYFDRVEFCNLSPDSLDEDLGKKWQLNIFEGAWRRGQSAGGCRNYIDTFANNPQYIIDLAEPDESGGDGKCTFIIALMQKNRRVQRKLGVDCLTIGFAIFRLTEDLPTPLPMEFFKFNPSVARSPTFINLREVCSRFRLPVGRYVIVPSTFEPNEEGEFIIRVFTEGQSEMMDGGN